MERNFNFPVPPYDVQQEFMSNLYECLSTCRVGIFESPTGTGKSLSLICSSFQWLKDNSCKKTEEFEGELDWLNNLSDSRAEALSDITNQDESKTHRNLTIEQKIVYISRTHTQLDQFLNEIKKTKYKNSMKVIRLGSRNQLCVNEEVCSLKSRSLLDNACKDLIDPASSGDCRYYKSSNKLKTHALSTCCDIEDLVSYGRAHSSCPYYATRNAINAAEVILAPYTLILNKRNRDSIGLNLENCILIIDEAHNIIDAMIDCYSASVSKAQLEAAVQALSAYFQRFARKIGAHSSLYFEHIIQILSSFINFVKNHKPMSVNIGEFLCETRTEKFDFFKILSFIEEFEVVRKVVGQNEKSGNKGSVIGINFAFEFLRVMADDLTSGKIFVNQSEELGLRFFLIDPKKKFAELAETTKCLVLAGGTMEPRAEYLDLFSGISNTMIKVFSCSHIISPNNLLMAVVNKGESESEFKFTYENRDNSKMTQDLHQLLLQVCMNVPRGIVVFVPSYFFLTKLKNSLEKSGTAEKISRKKKVFFDNKDENLLDSYCKHAAGLGAILFAVVRGKLSEGINFSDDLGRCVIMVGLPYLNRNDVEIQERMSFLDANSKHFSGKMFYESSCHKAINQSIGRAIRHKNDYAVVLLVDQRFSSCFDKRPAWMLRNLVRPNENLFSRIREFFEFHNKSK